MKTFRIYYGDQEYWITANRFRVDEYGIHFLDSQDQVIGYAPLTSVVSKTDEPELKNS